MARAGSVQKNERRRRMSVLHRQRRKSYKAVMHNVALGFEERFEAQCKLAAMPRDASYIRVRNRCGISQRPRGFYRKFNLSRIALRDLASSGNLPGVIKASW